VRFKAKIRSGYGFFWSFDFIGTLLFFMELFGSDLRPPTTNGLSTYPLLALCVSFRSGGDHSNAFIPTPLFLAGKA
jgi:hypothetical protein